METDFAANALHNVLLQQLLLSKQDLDGRLSERSARSASTNAAALLMSGQSRKALQR